MNGELNRIRKEVAVAYFVVIYPHLLGRNKESHEKLQLGYSASKLAPPEFKREAFPTQLPRSVKLLLV
jgi:hypothetical protein